MKKAIYYSLSVLLIFCIGCEPEPLTLSHTTNITVNVNIVVDATSITASDNDNTVSVEIKMSEIKDITSNSARCEGLIEGDLNSFDNLEYGICWDKQPDPTFEKKHKGPYPLSENFSLLMTDLEPNTNYYVKVYVVDNDKEINNIEYCKSELGFTTKE